MGEAVDRLRERLHPIPAGRYLIGLSGGADSVALLYMLLPQIRQGRIEAEAVHINHGLRGTDSDADEIFSEKLCREEAVPFSACRADLKGRRDEDAAREARYCCFRERMRETGADGLILAHHADDQAETFLMRLIRGAGPEGLGCMAPEDRSHGFLICRPMLEMKREEIREALRRDGITWREDISNEDPVYLRNRIRHELIPWMESVRGGAVGRICRTAGLIRADNEQLVREAEAVFSRAASGRLIDTRELKDLPAALLGRVFRQWWKENGPKLSERMPDERQTAAMIRLVQSERGRVNLPGGFHAAKGNRYIHLIPGERILPEPVNVVLPETRFGSFLLRQTESEGNPGDGKRSQEVPAGFPEGCVIRTRRPGDRITPFGSRGSRKLQDYLTDRKVDEAFRDEIPLLCRGNEVLLAGGIGAGNIPEWKERGDFVRLTWLGTMPWMD